MKKDIRVGLYSPYLDVLGGGEKHILSIIFVLQDLIIKQKNKSCQINIFWNKNFSKEIIERFTFKRFASYIKEINWISTKMIASSFNSIFNLRKFDYFFYVTNGSYFFSTAKKNYIFSMVPDKKLYRLNLLNSLKLRNFKFITNSIYTASWLEKWGIKSITIPPYIDEEFFINKNIKKEKIILSVGRFFKHLHRKNQEKIIQSFNYLSKNCLEFKDYKLILAGGLKKEDKQYFLELKKITKNTKNVVFKVNVSHKELIILYKKAKYFWHFTGLGIDENQYPEQVEHFGITPLEAMASRCLTFCHNSGNPKSFILNKINGFLFNNEKELIKRMVEIEKKQYLQEHITKQAFNTVKNNYNFYIFQEKIKLLL